MLPTAAHAAHAQHRNAIYALRLSRLQGDAATRRFSTCLVFFVGAGLEALTRVHELYHC